MRVATKLLVIVAFVSTCPLVVFSTMVVRIHERALGADVIALHAKVAELGARIAESSISEAREETAALIRAIPWTELSPAERHGALQLVYQQLDEAAAVLFVDGKSNVIDAITTGPKHDHPPPPGDATAFVRRAPIATAPVVTGEPGDDQLVPIAFATDAGTLVVAFSLHEACAALASYAGSAMSVRLEVNGRVLCGDAPVEHAVSGTAPMENGWRVVAEQPSDRAFASLQHIRAESWLWIALGAAAAVIAGIVLAQSIRTPVRKLAVGAQAIANGRYDHRIASTSRDELGDLANAFDRMAGEIERKNAELQQWNAELVARVAARTAELEQAQEQLLESRKLGAIAVLTAGVAHELNNPLAGVLGLTQVMLGRTDLDDRSKRSLGSIEREAERMRAIIEKMSTLSEPVQHGVLLEVADIAELAIERAAPRLETARIAFEIEMPAGLPRICGNRAQLEAVFEQLVDNAIAAMPDGGALTIRAHATGEIVTVTVADTGCGIEPSLHGRIFEPFFTTKDNNWRGVGLGLTVARQVIEAHHGRIRVASGVGHGTTMTLTFPAARRSSRLVTEENAA
ncbi:MAG TPA: HAMP domain-containing sensor histidine kinase [Kofleriaceae bacterium]|nr:HAMP domain-containing sensor histidine kinase [Kofleriaceae bacterium]